MNTSRMQAILEDKKVVFILIGLSVLLIYAIISYSITLYKSMQVQDIVEEAPVEDLGYKSPSTEEKMAILSQLGTTTSSESISEKERILQSLETETTAPTVSSEEKMKMLEVLQNN